MTKKENFVTIKAILNENGNTDFDEFLDKEVALLNKKRSSNTKAKAETEARAEKVYNALAEMTKPVTITELTKLTTDVEVADYSTSRVSALIRKLGDRVVREEVKGRAYFSIA